MQYRGRRKYVEVYAQCPGICYICRLSIEKEFARLMEWYDIKEKLKVGEKMPFKRREIKLNFDHVIPKSLKVNREALRATSNLRIVHKQCNSEKGSKILL